MSPPPGACPATRSVLPSSAPAGTFTDSVRPSTFRSMVPPRAAVKNGISATASTSWAAVRRPPGGGPPANPAKRAPGAKPGPAGRPPAQDQQVGQVLQLDGGEDAGA